jgi:COMPASS component SWD3
MLSLTCRLHSRLWSTSTSHCLKTLLPPDSKPVSYVHFTPSSNHLLAASLDSTIRLWDVPNDRVLKTYTGHRNVKWAIPAALTRATPLSDEEGKRHPRDAEMRHRNLPSIHVVAGSEDNRIYLWDLQTKEVRHVVEGHKEPVICIAVSRGA